MDGHDPAAPAPHLVQHPEGWVARIEHDRIETAFGQEGILAPYAYLLRNSSKKTRIAWYDYALRFCEKEDYLTHAEHLMIVSRKDSKG